MLDQSMSKTKYCLPVPPLPGNINNNRTHQHHTRRSNPYLSSVLVQTNESRKVPESKKTLSVSGKAPTTTASCRLPKPENKVGIIGGLSAFSTLIFLEKLVWWSTRNGGECLPFVVSSDPELSRYLPILDTPSASLGSKNGGTLRIDRGPIVENLKRKRILLEQSGACGIVMPCQVSHAWHGEVSEGCSLPFLHVGECVARELKEADLKPLEAGSNIRIGILGTTTTLMAGFYQEKLQNQGFEAVVPDSATIDHIVVPTLEAIKRNDKEGARNLLRVALQILLVRAVSTIILASDEMQGLLPLDDPLLKKCVNPMDALVRSTIKWARSVEDVHQRT